MTRETRNRAVPPVEHGGLDLQELKLLGVDPARVLDFSVCTNPYGPSPRIYDVLRHVPVEVYPDRQCRQFRNALAGQFGIASQRIMAGNGVSELIFLTAQAFVRPGDNVLVVGPTYGEYARSVLLQGGTIQTWNARAEERFAVVAQEIEAALAQGRPRLAFLCNPNNPTGAVVDPDVILSWITRNPHTLFVVDEAYQKFAEGLASLISAQENNLLVLRSMTKDYALAGLRIGYAVAEEQIIRALVQVRPPWSVSTMAQAAGLAALGDELHLNRSLEELARAKQLFVQALRDRGLAVWPSTTHYFLAKVGDASALRLALLRRGMLVRDATSFGLPAFVRLATRRPEENTRFLNALGEVNG